MAYTGAGISTAAGIKDCRFVDILRSMRVWGSHASKVGMAQMVFFGCPKK